MSYPINTGKRDEAIRMGCEKGLKSFLEDYAVEMGQSLSSATRRLVLIGARCEAEHGKARMPASYKNLRSPAEVEEDQALAMMLEEDL